jgi:hypothetical protein
MWRPASECVGQSIEWFLGDPFWSLYDGKKAWSSVNHSILSGGCHYCLPLLPSPLLEKILDHGFYNKIVCTGLNINCRRRDFNYGSSFGGLHRGHTILPLPAEDCHKSHLYLLQSLPLRGSSDCLQGKYSRGTVQYCVCGGRGVKLCDPVWGVVRFIRRMLNPDGLVLLFNFFSTGQRCSALW